jgi:quercetin dioxygenase-like cupin family protein
MGWLMSNFIFIKRNIDTSAVMAQLKEYESDWKEVSTYESTGGTKDPYGFLPLVMALTNEQFPLPKNTDLLQPTPMFTRHTEIKKLVYSLGVKKFSRAAYFKLEVGGSIGKHIDDGTYYLEKDRYHLSLSGRYLYNVDGEEHIIEPGTFFWFDNKKYHSALNVHPTEDRLTFVFDVPKSKDNPHHKVKNMFKTKAKVK